MILTLSNGDQIRFSTPYCVTTIGGLAIPDEGNALIHPYTLLQLKDNPHYDDCRGLMGKVRLWANRYKRNIDNSASSVYLHDMLDRVGLLLVGNVYEWRQEFAGYVDDETDPQLQVSGRGRGSVSTFTLLQRTANAPVGPQTYIYNGSNRSSIGYLRIQVIPEESSPALSEWDRLMNYTFTPRDMTFLTVEYEKTHMYFGMELELSSVLSPEEFQRINDTVEPVRERWFYFKEDSSVSGRYNRNEGNGFRMEMVTVPMSPKRMRREWKILFKKLDDLIRERGTTWANVFDLSTDLSNGIHIHVSKTAFVQNSPNDHRHKFRFMAAFNQWESSIQDWLQKVSKRPEKLSSNRYCYVHPGLDGRTLARRLRDGPTHDDRHAACHESNATVEVRIFQGIVDLSHILSCIDFVEAMFEFTQYAPHSAYGSKFSSVFTDFVFNHHRYKYAKEVLAQCA